MTAILIAYQKLSLDQKRNFGLLLITMALLLVYALSRVVEAPKVVIEESKPADFKSGSLTVDETPEFYRRKDEMMRKQNEAILANQKSLEEKVTELGKRMDDSKVGTTSSESAKRAGPPEPGEIGKKMPRRGQTQSIMNFPSATRMGT